MNELKEAIWWFENSICDDDPMHTDDNCPDCKNNRVALTALRAQLERESERGGWFCLRCNNSSHPSGARFCVNCGLPRED